MDSEEDTQCLRTAIRASHRCKGGPSGGGDDQITLREALGAWEELAAEDANAPPSGIHQAQYKRSSKNMEGGYFP